jgi:hypothetical protein
MFAYGALRFGARNFFDVVEQHPHLNNGLSIFLAIKFEHLDPVLLLFSEPIVLQLFHQARNNYPCQMKVLSYVMVGNLNELSLASSSTLPDLKRSILSVQNV